MIHGIQNSVYSKCTFKLYKQNNAQKKGTYWVGEVGDCSMRLHRIDRRKAIKRPRPLPRAHTFGWPMCGRGTPILFSLFFFRFYFFDSLCFLNSEQSSQIQNSKKCSQLQNMFTNQNFEKKSWLQNMFQIFKKFNEIEKCSWI